MLDLQPPEQRLFQALVQADPALEALAAESRDEADGFLEYIYLGDVAQHVAALSRGAPDAAGRSDRIFAALEAALDGDEHVTNLICVSFLEMLKATGALGQARGRFGPRLGFWADTV
jgi:hypothetical protein